MSTLNCAACDDLRNHAPLFSEHGITEYECNSLRNNTGLNPAATVLHRNDEDLHNINDCLIARMSEEALTRDVCDWRDFMKDFIPNLHALERAQICDSAGIWLKIDNHEYRIQILERDVNKLKQDVEDLGKKIPDTSEFAKKSDIPDVSGFATKTEVTNVNNRVTAVDNRVTVVNNRVTDLCRLMNQSLVSDLQIYGILTGSSFGPGDDPRRGGFIVQNKVVDLGTGMFNRVGFYYRKETFLSCDGNNQTYEWIQPTVQNYKYADNIAYGDILYRVPISRAKEWGMTDGLLNWLKDFPQWRGGYHNAFGEYHDSTIRFYVEGDYLSLQLIGGDGASVGGMHIDADTQAPALFIS